MLIKAVYEETKQECWVSEFFIADIFRDNQINKYRAYTMDNERGGYLIDEQDFKRLLESENKKINSLKEG